jgi:hypothetical protein
VGATFSWSASRHDTFSTCRRRYYYSYYLAEEDAEVKRLKRLSALPIWGGSVVHETIEGLLKSRDSIPSRTEQEAIVHATVHERMVADWRESESSSTHFRLFEHEYDVPVPQDDKRFLVDVVRRSLRNFFGSDVAREAYAAGRATWLTIEKLDSFRVDDVLVYVRMDFAFRSGDGRVVIVDWKTGRAEGRFNDTQLGGYALYATEQGWVESPEQIDTELAFLAIPRFRRTAVGASRIESARRFILESAASMRALLVDPAANTARIEDFPMIDRPQVCRRCNFRRLCFPASSQPGPAESSPPT